jgi:hypothetical protein
MGKPRGKARFIVVAALAALAALTAGGCASIGPSAAATVPASISPILDSWRNVGVSCGEPQVGMPENKPQWGCQGTLRGVRVNVVFVGDDAGVMDMEAQVAPATNAGTAAGVLDDLMAATPAFPNAMPAIRAWIADWDGSKGLVSAEMRNVRVAIESDATWITLSVSRDPLLVAPAPS